MSSDDEFEVERILASRTTRKGVKQFLVRWKGYGAADDTWEPQANLESARELVSAFTRGEGSGDFARTNIVQMNPVLKPIQTGSYSETRSVVKVDRHISSASISTSSTDHVNVTSGASLGQRLMTSEKNVKIHSSQKRNRGIVSSLFLGQFVRQSLGLLLFSVVLAFSIYLMFLVSPKSHDLPRKI